MLGAPDMPGGGPTELRVPRPPCHTAAYATIPDEGQAVNMMRATRSFLVLLVLLASHLTALSSAAEPSERNALFQVSTLSALLAGLYDGVVNFAALSVHGDFGIGTIDRLDGEMIEVNGVFYRIAADGTAHRVSDDATTPFACVTFFDPDLTAELPQGMNYADISDFLTTLLPTCNLFYAIRVDGTFSYVRARSVPAQEPPYRPLTAVVAEQSEFEFRDVEGTLIGFRCPDFVAGLNVAGDHFHFITKDRTAGGHVLDLVIANATLMVDITPTFVLELPLGNEPFYTIDLSEDIEQATEAVEK
jgi:acetolactate decarboxylase